MQQPQQLNVIPHEQQLDTTELQNVPDTSETVTIQNISELSDITENNTQSFTTATDSNMLQVPVHNIIQNTTNGQHQDEITQNLNQDTTSSLSTSKTSVTQPFQTQQTSPRNYVPPPPLVT